MITEFSTLHRFTPEGLELFNRVMTGQVAESALDPSSTNYASPVADTSKLAISHFATAKEMAQAICTSFGGESPQALAGDIGLWAWLTFVFIDSLFPGEAGHRKIKELNRWYPAAPNDWQKAQRHLVRMPVLLYYAFGDDADHLICGKPHVGPDIREQLTAQQDMFSPNFIKAGRILYFDESKNAVKFGASSKGAGTVRRLRDVRKQLDVTWDMTDLSPQRILELLPEEFDRFRLEGSLT
jgi:hypothetical protein